MKKHILLVVITIFFLPALAISQAIEWQNSIGGSLNEWLYSLQQTTDGGYILGGWSESDTSGDKTENCIGLDDFWIVKTDSTGTLQWQNTIGGSNYDDLLSLQQTTDGGYILGGASHSNISGDKTEINIGLSDVWIVKTDASGVIQWQNTIGGSLGDGVRSIKQTTDGGYILGGCSESNISGDKTENSNGSWDYWIVKTDSTGAVQWQNTIGGSDMDELFSISQTSDGGYILGGQSVSNISGDKTENSNGMLDIWIVKTDASGTIQWQNTIGGSSVDAFRSIQQTTDGGYILGGASISDISGDKSENSIGGSSDFWIIKTNAFGVIQWQNTIGGTGSDGLFAIEQTYDGGYILGGSSTSDISGDKTENCNGVVDYWIVKTDTAGVIQWQNTIGGNDHDAPYSLQQTADGGYILGGYSVSNISGDKTENNVGGSDYWVIKIAGEPNSISEITAPGSLLLYPNPANSTLTIEAGDLSVSDCKLSISDVAGRIMFSKSITTTATKHNIDISSFSHGIYFVQLQTGENISRGRFVKE